MCGIVGAIGLKDTKKFLLDGLKELDYRGYDSAGIALLKDDNIECYKAVGAVSNLESLIDTNLTSSLGIGHTRWATHGKPSTINCHPHASMHKLFYIVHNGVIENYASLKSDLINKGFIFKSETDTEVIANQLEDNYFIYRNVIKAIEETMKMLKGSFAVAIITEMHKNHLFVMKRSSPLMIAISNDNFSLVASDASPMIRYTDKFIDLEDEQYGSVSRTSVHLYKDGEEVEYTFTEKSPDLSKRDLMGYPHFMIKEIEEIEKVIRRLKVEYYDHGEFCFDKQLLKDIENSDHIIFVGCGTSYHASLVGARYFEKIGKTASCYIASEWGYYPRYSGNKPFFIFLSQSGETADVIRCLKIIKEKNIKSLVLTNTKGSSLERGCTYSLLLYAGLEVSVASTKAYVAEVTALALLTASLIKNVEVISDLEKCCDVISDIRQNKKDKIMFLAEKLKDEKDIYFLGRGYDYDLSLEASLKLKEISYIHSDAVPGGELKHGPIALMDNNTPVIVTISDPITSHSMRGNVCEVESRGAVVYVVSTASLSKEDDYLIIKDHPSYLSPIVLSSFGFYFAYYVTTYKGFNVDKPRNLAKAVTVE